MKITPGTIVDFEHEFDLFSQSLARCDYNVYFRVKKFEHKISDLSFTLQDLRHIFFDEEVDGLIEEVSLVHATSEVKKALAHENDVEISTDEEFIKNREKIFWGILKGHFSFPPVVVYEHSPSFKTYFDFYVMWGFCFILLNDEEGLVLSGGAFD